MNPMSLFQLKNLWAEFTVRHPKFHPFIKAVMQNGIQEGMILEMQVTTPDGRNLATNLRVTREDVELYQKLVEMRSRQQ